ncbi:MAG: stalk domain-containing protein [Clostridia bacterium]
MKKLVTSLIILTLSLFGITAMAKDTGGLVAVGVEDGVYLSWQMTDLGTYNLYRDGSLILTTDKTNYTDTEGNEISVYNLEGKDTVTVWAKGYLEIPLSIPTPTVEGVTYSPNDCAIGDLDGDGEYEIVLKWDPSDSKDAATGGNSDRIYIDAYKLDGTFMWRINMGINIRAGAHDTQMVVYDLDGDGKAELALRTCDGTVDGTGTVIGDPNAVYTNNWCGKNIDGPLFLSVFEGATGKEVARVPFDPQNNEPNTIIFGDDAGNRSERYNACVAFLDGVTPHIVTQRGYYHGRANKGPGRTVVASYTYKDGTLTKVWRFDTMDEGNEIYIGQGNHNLSVGDADNDGCDEIFFGSLTLDHDGSVLWCSGKGHGDAQHLGDFDPDNEGMEYFSVHESAPYGYTIYDAATGDIIFDEPAGKDTGRGLISSPGPFRGSFIVNVGSGARRINSLGETVTDVDDCGQNFRIYWDGDLYDEYLNGTAITDVNTDGKGVVLLDTKNEGCASNNSTKSNPCLQADFLGDWREEVIWRTQDNSAIRIYTTTIPTEFSVPPLMTDHVYEMGIVWQNSSYNQPPHLSYYLESGVTLTIDSPKADINGVKLDLDAPAYIENGRTMVPLRFISEAFDAEIGYDRGVVEVNKNGIVIKMTIGETSYTVNNKEYFMDTAPKIVNDRTMVPVRVVVEALGMNVQWNENTKQVSITRGKARRDKVKIFIAGDSTAQSYRENMAPQAGWGQMLHMFFDDSVIIENRAMAGRSLKSFFNEGRWGGILNDAQEGDYVIIQFGHNEGSYNKPERYISHEDFTTMLENEYITPAIEKGLNVIIATQTQSRWFNEETGTIWEPGDEVSYASLLRDAAEKYNLPLIDINASSRALANSYGMEGSKKIYLHASAREYEKYPDGVSDNTHFSFHGAFKIASLMAEGLNSIDDLAVRKADGYSYVATVNGTQTFDVRMWGAEKCRVVLVGDTNVKINGETYLTWDMADELVGEVSCKDSITISSDGEVKVEITPVFTFAPTGGINTANGEYSISLPKGTYDFAFTKNDRERANIWLNGFLVGANVDMYGTVGVPDGTRHEFTNVKIEDTAKIKLTEKSFTLEKVEAYRTPTIINRKTKVFVGGDSTLCNYYPVLPDKTDDEIAPGTIRTGWAQVLDRYLSDEYEVVNLASSGDWANNWKNQAFPTVMENAEKGDYLIIQFGINDRNRDDKTKDTMYNALYEMVTKAQGKGINVILVKPQPSVGYSWGNAGDFEKPNGNNGGFFDVPYQVCEATGCTFVDLNNMVGDHFAQMGREYVSQNYQLWDYNTSTMSDKLHISFDGANKCAELFAAYVNEKGILKSRDYMKVTSIVSDVYVFENGTDTVIYNNSPIKKEVYVGSNLVTVAPFSKITKYGVLNG